MNERVYIPAIENDKSWEFTGLPKPVSCPKCGSWVGVMGRPSLCGSCLFEPIRNERRRW